MTGRFVRTLWVVCSNCGHPQLVTSEETYKACAACGHNVLGEDGDAKTGATV